MYTMDVVKIVIPNTTTVRVNIRASTLIGMMSPKPTVVIQTRAK
ncbi:Uncharacterised protein [Mycobacterium tuberculosis]|nr:Uncharacterised protein [Mycobacterium tuberculosis]